MQELNQLSDRIIGCAIEVHRALGPGLLESLYEKALCWELETREIFFGRQVSVPLLYKGQNLGDCRLDLLVEDKVVVELKAIDRFDPVFQAQVLSYLKLTGKNLGLQFQRSDP